MHTRSMLSLSACLLLPLGAIAQDEKPERAAIGGNLDNPCGIAVQPETGDLIVSTNKRVIRFHKDGEKWIRKGEIAWYPTDIYGKGPQYEIGPLGVAFLQDGTLVVGDGGFVDGSELLRFYKIGSTASEKPAKYTTMWGSAGPIGPGDDSPKGEGNFYGLAVIGDAVWVTCNGDDTKGWVAKCVVNGKPGDLKPTIATKVATNVDAPTGATKSPDRKLVISQLGEINIPADSLLTFYDPESGKLTAKYETGLNDLLAVAYHPTSGKLYGLDYSWMAPEKGGLFALEIQGDAVKTKKIAKLDKPTAMAFGPDGTLYVTLIGSAPELTEEEKKAQEESGKKKFPGRVVSFKNLK